ncbi:hypothetical protein FQV27_18245 [Paracoccus aurantiacus]|uniref:Uncharacterized protein n=1 Tax=Paracoccus aurantiacus TaxID=2599412 RepID=A0A5C6RR37_9RHOB|nr:hypothetical protein [Paracoccus aurantiacus]TXB63852.1 hypothetical protein FQV27_18245 [Paracoccus aurantiacus]
MLSDIASVGFKVENFTAENMAVLEKNWPSIQAALKRSVELVASFGLNGQTLRADSALLPIAYYLHHAGVPSNYVTHSSFAKDREQIRRWLIHSLLKASGIWGSGLDTLLSALRDEIRREGGDGFPEPGLRRVMIQRGKSLTFETEEIEELLHLEYGDKRTFSLLSLLFSFVDLRNQFNVDHVFPISRFTRAKLQKIEGDPEEAETIQRMANCLPNLQLLEGPINNEKRARLPAEWLREHLAVEKNRQNYLDNHLLGELPEDISNFRAFYEARREKLRPHIEEMLATPR